MENENVWMEYKYENMKWYDIAFWFIFLYCYLREQKYIEDLLIITKCDFLAFKFYNLGILFFLSSLGLPRWMQFLFLLLLWLFGLLTIMAWEKRWITKKCNIINCKLNTKTYSQRTGCTNWDGQLRTCH